MWFTAVEGWERQRFPVVPSFYTYLSQSQLASQQWIRLKDGRLAATAPRINSANQWGLTRNEGEQTHNRRESFFLPPSCWHKSLFTRCNQISWGFQRLILPWKMFADNYCSACLISSENTTGKWNVSKICFSYLNLSVAPRPPVSYSSDQDTLVQTCQAPLNWAGWHRLSCHL